MDSFTNSLLQIIGLGAVMWLIIDFTIFNGIKFIKEVYFLLIDVSSEIARKQKEY